MEYRDLPAAERVKKLVEVVTPLVTLMAEQIAMLRGRMDPELLLENPHRSGSYITAHGDLRKPIDDNLESGAIPIGYRYDSAEGIVRQPIVPGDATQIQKIRDWEREPKLEKMTNAELMAMMSGKAQA